MAENIKHLCAPIPEALHTKLREQQEKSGKNLSQYMTWLITQFYEYEQGGKSTTGIPSKWDGNTKTSMA